MPAVQLVEVAGGDELSVRLTLAIPGPAATTQRVAKLAPPQRQVSDRGIGSTGMGMGFEFGILAAATYLLRRPEPSFGA